ncbi:MAG: hypothetical protein JNM74_02620 [Myxococcales bacterium]|nr:hypothetical protein [Myxococcales bacterium]
MTIARRTTSILAALAAITAVWSGPACTSSPCGAACPADPEPSAKARQECEDRVTDFPTCQASYDALRDCSDGLTVCGRDDRTDVAATTQVVLKECGPLLAAYTDCTSRAR